MWNLSPNNIVWAQVWDQSIKCLTVTPSLISPKDVVQKGVKRGWVFFTVLFVICCLLCPLSWVNIATKVSAVVLVLPCFRQNPQKAIKAQLRKGEILEAPAAQKHLPERFACKAASFPSGVLEFCPSTDPLITVKMSKRSNEPARQHPRLFQKSFSASLQLFCCERNPPAGKFPCYREKLCTLAASSSPSPSTYCDY